MFVTSFSVPREFFCNSSNKEELGFREHRWGEKSYLYSISYTSNWRLSTSTVANVLLQMTKNYPYWAQTPWQMKSLKTCSRRDIFVQRSPKEAVKRQAFETKWTKSAELIADLLFRKTISSLMAKRNKKSLMANQTTDTTINSYTSTGRVCVAPPIPNPLSSVSVVACLSTSQRELLAILQWNSINALNLASKGPWKLTGLKILLYEDFTFWGQTVLKLKLNTFSYTKWSSNMWILQRESIACKFSAIFLSHKGRT